MPELIDLETDLQGQLAPLVAELTERLGMDDPTLREHAAIGSALVKAASAGSRIVVGIFAYEMERHGVSLDVEKLTWQGVDAYAELYGPDC